MMPSKGLLLFGHISQTAFNHDFSVRLTTKTDAFKS